MIFLVFGFLCRHTTSISITSGVVGVLGALISFWVVVILARVSSFMLFCYDATHQVVSRDSNKEARKRLEDTPAMDLGHMNVILRWIYLNVGSVFRMWNVVLK